MTALAVMGQGALADALRALCKERDMLAPETAHNDRLLVAGQDLAATLTQVRQCHAAAIVIIVPDTLAPLERHLLQAAIAPLAIEAAPAQRVSAVAFQVNANLADVLHAAQYLVSAQAVTGQVLTVGAACSSNAQATR